MTLKVVYIDDEVDSDKELIKIEWLLKNDVEIIPVKDVTHALPTLRLLKAVVDAVLLDILMPPLGYYTLDETASGTDTGMRLLRDIRAEFPKLKIIIISVKPPVEVTEQAAIDGYLYKPVLGIDILDEIHRVVGRN